MNKNNYSKYVQATNQDGSNKAASYIKAIDWLYKMLEIEPYSYVDCINVWNVNSADRIHELYEFVLIERRKGSRSSWNVEGIPISYLRDGFCSAALKSYESFLVENGYEQQLINIFNAHEGASEDLTKKLDIMLDYPKYLLEGLDEKQGTDIIRNVRVRSNQNVFRKMVLTIYNQSCCITGLNIPETNRASHIIPWAADETKRLDPTNGLCLSATYDAAFDRNLISLDEEYRLIISNEIKDYVTNECVKEYFINKAGMHITLPERYKPNKDYLAAHRNSGHF